MHQKELVKQAWVEAGLYRGRDVKLAAFLEYFDRASMDCWPEVVKELREHYPELKERLVIPIWNTQDKLLRLNVIRAIDFERKDEADLLQKLVRRTDAATDTPELHAV